MNNKLWLIVIAAFIGLAVLACEDFGEDLINDSILLTEGVWEQEYLDNKSSEILYSFDVKSGTQYYVWVREHWTSGTSGFADVVISAEYQNGTSIFSNSEAGASNSTAGGSISNPFPPSDFTANSDSTVLIRVQVAASPALNADSGQFWIAYTTTSNRPAETITPETNPQIISGAGVWAEGSLANENSAVWFAFRIKTGATYYIWVKDLWSSSVSSDSGYADVLLTVKYQNGSNIVTSTENGAITPVILSAAQNGRVLIKVHPVTGALAQYGNFKVTFSTSTSRPSGE